MLSTVVVVAAAMVVLIVALGLLLSRLASEAVDQELTDRAVALVSGTRVADDGTVRVAPRALVDGDAVLARSGRVLAGAVDGRVAPVLPGMLDEVMATRAGDGSGVRREADDEARVLVQPFRAGGRDLVAVVDEPLGAYERVEQLALAASIGLGVVVVLGAGALAAWTTRRALLPVTTMAEAAEEWSRTDLDRRFGPESRGAASEITRLADTLDGLLDRVATAIQGEQRLTAELAHELRTPLAGVQGTVELALLRDDLDPGLRADLEEVHTAGRRMADTISTLLALAREQAETGGQVGAASTRLGDALAGLPLEGVRLPESAGWEALSVRAPRTLVTGALAPLLENAHRHARGVVALEVHPRPDQVVLRVRDDGAGVPAEQDEVVFLPGTSTSGGTGLGLAVARRLARSFGGDVVVHRGGSGGSFDLVLPRLP